MLDSKRIKETLIIRDIENTARTLREMVDYLKAENHDKDEAINQIVKINHPLVGRIKEALGIKYNIYIDGKDDLEYILKSRGYKWDPFDDVWERQYREGIVRLSISEELFDVDGNLKYMKATDWDNTLFKVEKIIEKDDDLPF